MDPERPYCDLAGEYGPANTCIAEPPSPDAGLPDAGTGPYALSVSMDGAGTGTVVSEPAGIVCGSTCEASFDEGTQVVLTALADDDSDFAGWSRAACAGSEPCAVTMNGPEEVAATFNLKQRVLSVALSGDGTGSVTSDVGAIDCGSACDDSYDHGTVVTLTAAPSGTSTFGGWSGACTGLDPTCVVTMDAMKFVGAAFDLDQKSLSVSLLGAGGGTVTSDVGAISCPGTCSDSYLVDTMVTLTAAPDGTSTFEGWSGACSTISTTCVVTMDAAKTVTATFEPQLVTLTVVTSGTGSGSVTSTPSGIDCPGTCSASFVVGTVVSLAPNPGADSTFESWSGACSGTGSCSATLDADKSVTAIFDLLAPPIVDGQAADVVLGQSDFTSTGANAGGESAGSLNFPAGAASDGAFLWVGDSLNGRVLQWSSLPIVNKANASKVVGQGSFTSHTSATTQTTMRATSDGMRVVSDGTKLYVSNPNSNRVLIWNAIPTSNGKPADVVVGQTNFTNEGSGKSSTQMNAPEGVWSDGTHLIVVDKTNSRVLIWNSVPTTNGQAADVVLGRDAFGLGFGDAIADPPTASSMANPRDVYYDGARLYVADSGNNRVLVWNGIPTSNGAAADYVIGQGSFGGKSANAGGAAANAVGLSSPSGIVVAFGSLFITDAGNHRVVVHTPVPTASGESADAVLGQDDLVTGDLAASASASRMNRPRGIAVFSDKLFVVDNGWNRALRFDLNP